MRDVSDPFARRLQLELDAACIGLAPLQFVARGAQLSVGILVSDARRLHGLLAERDLLVGFLETAVDGLALRVDLPAMLLDLGELVGNLARTVPDAVDRLAELDRLDLRAMRPRRTAR